MKRKITSIENLKDFFAEKDWGVKSLSDSPLPEVTLPPSHIFVAGSASPNMVSNYSGPSLVVAGMDIFRRDLKDYPYVVNVNHYSIYSTGNQRLFEIIEDKPEYHWVKSLSEIPQSIRDALPPMTYKNVEELLEKGFLDVIGLAVTEKEEKT